MVVKYQASKASALATGSGDQQLVGSPEEQEDSWVRRYLSSTELPRLFLRDMHVILVKIIEHTGIVFCFLLMDELRYRYIVGVERLHVGRTTLARP